MNERKIMFWRTTYQSGSLRRVERKRGPDVWEFRWRDAAVHPGASRVYRNLQVGTVKQYRTEAAARRALEAMRLDINQPTRTHTVQMTVSELIEHYRVKELGPERATKAATTVEVYQGFMSTWIIPHWGHCRLADVRTAAVEEWLRSPLKSKGTGKRLADGTKAKIRNIFSALFSHAIRWEFIDRNPITGPSKGAGVRQSAKRQRTPDVLTVNEIRAILGRLEASHRTIVFLAASTGFRSSELRGLKWQDIDFTSCGIDLQRGVVRHHVGKMKTAGSRRVVPISPELASALHQLRQSSAYNRPEDWVLASEQTKGRSPLWLNTLMDKHVRPAVSDAQIGKHVTWHTFRHSFATLLKANGEDVKTVQESLRHSTVRITMETYTQAIPQHVRQAQQKIAGLLVAPAEMGGADAALAL
jgi:integrase